MPYYTRVFCSSDNIPPLGTIIDDLKAKGINLEIDQNDNPVSIDEPNWQDVSLLYKKDRSPIIVECNKDDGSEDCLVRVEPAEFIEEIGSPGLSSSKRRVIKHLKKTKCIISCQLLSDIDDDGYDANGEFMMYFVKNCGGMIQADGEGFYDGPKLIVPLK